MQAYLRIVIVLLLLAMLTGCSKLTMENYSKIRMGSEYAEVARILGKPDNCSEALFIRTCIWGNERKNITVSFVGDKAVLFTSSNIR
jgi:hypothetical protein